MGGRKHTRPVEVVRRARTGIMGIISCSASSTLTVLAEVERVDFWGDGEIWRLCGAAFTEVGGFF